MRGLPIRIGDLGVIGLVLGGSAVIAYWVIGLLAPPAAAPSASSPSVSASPVAAAEPFTTRFPAALIQAPPSTPPSWIGGDGGKAFEQLAMAAAPSTATSVPQPASTGSIGGPSPAAIQRNANRKPTVFNDAQIASIKSRLNLTKDQEQFWPAVEAELRRLAWKKSPDDPHHKGAHHLVALDVTAGDIAKLRSTTGPLLMSFNDEQKRELRMLAHLAGMQDLFSNF